MAKMDGDSGHPCWTPTGKPGKPLLEQRFPSDQKQIGAVKRANNKFTISTGMPMSTKNVRA